MKNGQEFWLVQQQLDIMVCVEYPLSYVIQIFKEEYIFFLSFFCFYQG